MKEYKVACLNEDFEVNYSATIASKDMQSACALFYDVFEVEEEDRINFLGINKGVGIVENEITGNYFFIFEEGNKIEEYINMKDYSKEREDYINSLFN